MILDIRQFDSGCSTNIRCIGTWVLPFFLLLISIGCQSVKPYQRTYLNDHEMQAGQKNAAKPEQNAMSYREGAMGGGGGKASGGCGCN